MMDFLVDYQTISDLQIFPDEKSEMSVLKLFDHTKTHGGKARLREMLGNPIADSKMINERKESIYFLHTVDIAPDVDANMLDFIEHYLNQTDYPVKINRIDTFRAWEKAFFNKLKPCNKYYIIKRGIAYVLDMMNAIHEFAVQISEMPEAPVLMKDYCDRICDFFTQHEYAEIAGIQRFDKQKKPKILNPGQMLRFDYMFRYTHKKQVRFFLDLAYECDAFQSITRSTEKYFLSFPEVLSSSDNELDIKGLFHPFINQPVCNDICFSEKNNLIFITGPNMAGKSTFLKALGIAVYLAHTGFPVPAAQMRVSILSGISITINIPDDLRLGYSHFYSEVRRIKRVAENIQTNRNMLVIFDELFRGTNVKDAHEGSFAVISAFAKVNTCFFAISTHIVEVAENLVNQKNIRFYFFDAEAKDDIPLYTYQLKEGITNTRLGMHIIHKEKIIETIALIQ